MKWSTACSLAYFGFCCWFALLAQFQGGTAAERWLTLQGLTFPWGIVLSYLPHEQLPEVALTGCYLGGAVLNAGLVCGGLRLSSRLISRLERLDETPSTGRNDRMNRDEQ